MPPRAPTATSLKTLCHRAPLRHSTGSVPNMHPAGVQFEICYHGKRVSWFHSVSSRYLITHSTHKRETSMPPEGFEPATQQASGRRPPPYMARPMGQAPNKSMKKIIRKKAPVSQLVKKLLASYEALSSTRCSGGPPLALTVSQFSPVHKIFWIV